LRDEPRRGIEIEVEVVEGGVVQTIIVGPRPPASEAGR